MPIVRQKVAKSGFSLLTHGIAPGQTCYEWVNSFSSGVGWKKTTWKGGTIGHSINMKPGELHAVAFKRYCDENELSFISSK